LFDVACEVCVFTPLGLGLCGVCRACCASLLERQVARARRKTRHARRLPEKAKVDVAALEQNMRNQKNDVGTGWNIRGIGTPTLE
jgi:hypothetical protein